VKKLLLVILILFQATFTFGASYPSIPYTFAARQLIDAAKENANFTALLNGMIDGAKKLNINELWINGTKIINSSGVVSSYYLDVVNEYAGDISAAITDTSNKGKYTLLINDTVTLTASVNIAANIDLKFIDTGVITGSYTVTMNNSFIYAPRNNQIFSVYTTVTGSVSNDDIYVNWFGALPDDSTEDTTQITNAFNLVNSNDCNLAFLAGTYDCDSLSFLGATNIKIKGVPGTVLDFSEVTSGDGLTIGYNATAGGSKWVDIRNIQITDSSNTSNVTKLLVIEGGATGESPSQTSAYLNLNNVRIRSFASQTGTAIYIDNISHLTGKEINMTASANCKYGLYITNSENINTGVITFINCEFRAGKYPVYLYAQSQLIDTIDFIGCYIGNSGSGYSPEESIYIDATAQMSAVNFYGNHIENRSDTETAAVSITGNYYSSEWNANHFSCGTGTTYTDIGIKLGGGEMKALSFKNNEFLRVQGTPTGSCFYFSDTITVDKRNPIEIGAVWKAISSPDTIQIASGATQNVTRKAIVSYPNTTDQTGLDYVYDATPTSDTTPDVSGISMLDLNDPLIITNFANGIEGQELWVYSSTSDVVITHNASIANLGDTPVTLNAGESAKYIKRGIWRQMSNGKYGFSAGSFGIGAVSAKWIYDMRVKATSVIILQSANSPAGTLMGGSRHLYVANIEPLVRFQISTADGNNCSGTELFEYIIINK
jgi:hypothetical protein